MQEYEDAAQIAPPTLVLSGQYTARFMRGVAEELHRTIPNNQLAIVPQAAHYPHLENPEQCSAEMLAFFAEHAG